MKKKHLKDEPSQHFSQARTCGRSLVLLDLLVVLGITGMLSAISFPSLIRQINKAQETEASTRVGYIASAQQAYFLEKGQLGELPDLGLNLNNTVNYTYSLTLTFTNTRSEAIARATPDLHLRGFASRSWVELNTNGTNIIKTITCKGRTPSEIPEVSGRTICP